MGERIAFDSDGTTIVGTLDGDCTGAGVVLVHGFRTGKDSGTNLALAERLRAAGITTLRIDIFGHGESGGDFQDVTCTAGIRNVHDALDELTRRGCTRLGLFGSSFGGFLAYHVAAARTDLVAVAVKCPVADWTGFLGDPLAWKERGSIDYNGAQLKWAFYEDAVTNPAYDVAPSIAAPVLIVHGDADALVPVEQSRRMAERIPRCMLLVIDGADHRFSDGQHYAQMVDALADFMIEHTR